MKWNDVSRLLASCIAAVFILILGSTLLYFYPLIGPIGVFTFALLLSMSWAVAYLGVQLLAWLGKINHSVLISLFALFLLLHGLLDEMTLQFQAVLTLLILLVAGILTMVWLQELRYWAALGVTREKLMQCVMLAGIISLSTLIYAFSGKEQKADKQPQKDIKHLCYGSGHDKRRAIYAEKASLITPTVDASHLVTNWAGFHGYIRTQFWDFGPDSLPLNGQVWYPAGKGKKPLVLIAHGNHLDQDFSDGGFGYLGEYLAAQGYIAVSVDENFLNSSWAELADGIGGDIPARAWLLLKHLEIWQQWNSRPGNKFYGQVDMSRIALIGHSRGGEAVAWAHYLNELPYEYNKPEEPRKEKFGIRTVISITPTDAYRASTQGLLHLSDVNYLQISAGQDLDLHYHSAQYGRVSFTDGKRYLKASVFIPEANHNQFNTSWGCTDLLFPNSLFVSLEKVMPPAEQQTLAKASILAFLQSSFETNTVFTDWYKSQSFPGQYQYSGTVGLATFEEDQNLKSATPRNSVISARNFQVWEEKALFAAKDIPNGRALHLSWKGAEKGEVPIYRLDSLHIHSPKAVLTFDLLPEQETGPLVMEVILTDEQGNTSVHIVKGIRRVRVNPEEGFAASPFFQKSEEKPKVFQTVEVPLSQQRISSVQLIFKSPGAGSLWIDSVQLQAL